MELVHNFGQPNNKKYPTPTFNWTTCLQLFNVSYYKLTTATGNTAKLKYMGNRLTNENDIHDEIKVRFNSGNVRNH
jgi:hypothetical protein